DGAYLAKPGRSLVDGAACGHVFERRAGYAGTPARAQRAAVLLVQRPAPILHGDRCRSAAAVLERPSLWDEVGVRLRADAPGRRRRRLLSRTVWRPARLRELVGSRRAADTTADRVERDAPSARARALHARSALEQGRPDRIQGAAHGFAAHVAVQCAQLSAAHAAGVGRRTESIAVRRSHDDTELGVPCVANLVLLQAESADRLLCGLLDQSAGGRDDRAHRADRAHRVPQSELRLDAVNASRRWTAVARRSLHCVAALILSICVIAASADSPEELTVTGRYPGPPLWKVSAGTHELLIFGTLPVIPKDITWGSVLVERAIARADEVLLPPGVDAAAHN